MIQPEVRDVKKPFEKYCKSVDDRWRFLNIHGNMYSATLPDCLAIHPTFGNKLIEYKVRKERKNSNDVITLHGNQARDWAGINNYINNGLSFWVIAAFDLNKDKHLLPRLYAKLFSKPNCEYLLHKDLHYKLF